MVHGPVGGEREAELQFLVVRDAPEGAFAPLPKRLGGRSVVAEQHGGEIDVSDRWRPSMSCGVPHGDRADSPLHVVAVFGGFQFELIGALMGE
jgi:hypothetical protein